MKIQPPQQQQLLHLLQFLLPVNLQLLAASVHAIRLTLVMGTAMVDAMYSTQIMILLLQMMTMMEVIAAAHNTNSTSVILIVVNAFVTKKGSNMKNLMESYIVQKPTPVDPIAPVDPDTFMDDFDLHIGAKPNFLSRHYQEFDA